MALRIFHQTARGLHSICASTCACVNCHVHTAVAPTDTHSITQALCPCFIFSIDGSRKPKNVLWTLTLKKDRISLSEQSLLLKSLLKKQTKKHRNYRISKLVFEATLFTIRQSFLNLNKQGITRVFLFPRWTPSIGRALCCIAYFNPVLLHGFRYKDKSKTESMTAEPL